MSSSPSALNPALQRAPRRGVALLLALLVTGLGQAYLGYWRRAVLWATLPLLVAGAFDFAVLRFDLRSMYGWVLPVAVCVWVVPRLVAFWEVRSLPVRASGRSATGALLAFVFGNLVYTFAVLMFEGENSASVMTMQSRVMQPTLLEQERVMVDLRAYRSRPPQRGELVAIGSPSERRAKRVIGLPGDRVELSDGALLINGWAVPRCEVGSTPQGDAMSGTFYLELLGDAAYLTFWNRAPASAPRVWLAGANDVVLLGDDRNDSQEIHSGFASDAHAVRFGQLEGRPTFVFMGLDYVQDFDWSRFGLALDVPQLPKDLKGLDDRFRKCLSGRPPRTASEPPTQH